MIVFNTDFVLRDVIRSVLPYAHEFVIVEGPVKYWQERGYTTSTDRTNEILAEFPITRIHGQWEEKTEMCQAGMWKVPEDTDYLWCIDADEVFRPQDVEKVIDILQQEQPSTVGFQSNTFFGGFDRIMGGFERRHNFRRILKYTPGCNYKTHRPPTLDPKAEGIDIYGHQMAEHGVEMYHYSYVSARQVKDKIDYYESDVIKKGDCIPNYFEDVWLEWAIFPEKRPAIETEHGGVHEFRYGVRGDAYTEIFEGEHPIRVPVEEYQKQIEQCL